MPNNRKKSYTSGDQIHFIVTEDFVDIANEFATYCRENSINTSGAIRKAIEKWYVDKVAKERMYEQFEKGDTLRKVAEVYEREVFKED